MNRIEKAVNLKSSGACNCCQAVCSAYSDLVKVSEADLMKIASGFCLGFGTMEGTCGALVGANIILGLINESGPTLKLSRNLITDFKNLSGATKCGDLKGVTTGKMLCSCNDCVKNASIVLEKTLKDNNLFKEEK
ncbi:MAG: C-GCAxxG-C-C family protein [Acholeplasmatales bacterium]|nr:C-GCAxxG-C-C family protein [Acholeplasmatales bacterium]